MYAIPTVDAQKKRYQGRRCLVARLFILLTSHGEIDANNTSMFVKNANTVQTIAWIRLAGL